MTETPLYPFGYGLSYTTFDISKGRLSKNVISTNQTVTFKANVKNTGKREGTEVVQVYVRKVGDKEGPVKTLRAFRSKAGKSSVVSIDLRRERLNSSIRRPIPCVSCREIMKLCMV